MAEAKKTNYANIENINTLLGAEGIGALVKEVQGTEKRVGDILKKLSELENLAKAKAQEEAAKAEEARVAAEKAAAEQRAAEAAAQRAAEAAKAEKEAVAEKAPEPAREESPAPAKAEKTDAESKAEAKGAAADKTDAAGSTAAEENTPAPEKREQKAPEQKNERVYVREDARNANGGAQVRPSYVNNAQGSRPAYGDRPQYGERSQYGSRPSYGSDASRQGGRPAYGERGQYGDRQQNGDRNGFNRDRRPQGGSVGTRPAGAPGTRPAMGQRPSSPRPAAGGARFGAAPAVVPPVANKNFGAAKKKAASYEKPYTEQKKTVSKRALVKQQVSVSDFDEDKSGYRKVRVKKQKQQTVQTIKIEHAVVTSENIPLKVLSEKLGIPAIEITKRLFKEGIAKTINDSLDYDTAAYIASDLGIELEYKPEKTAEEALSEIYAEEAAGGEGAVVRPPVVTVMGHVDHGKTSLLDKIRSTNVTAGEAGGITQHIGAYSVNVGGKTITFLDTPGHEAFTAMRARGASVTDIVVLVVAADDGIMPQTVEAINHAKAADVPIIVAVNKMDKPEANLDRVKQGLTNNGLVPEEWGGDTIVCPVSAKTGDGIDNLLDTINLVAEVKELKANPDQAARGTIIEAKLDKGKGPVASVLIQNGTLHTGDSIISGTTTGRVRAMIDDKGRTVKSAGPSMAVSILGLEDVPNAGDSIFAVDQDKLLKQVLDERKRKESESMIKSQSRVTLDDVFGKIAEGKIKGLNIIVKGDVQGSAEAVKQSLLKLSGEEVRVNVLHSGAGAITESDVMLADSSNAIIVGFNVRPDTKAKALAERSGVDVRTYRIIYELLDDIQAALKGMLAPKYREIMTGKCDVLQTFKITGVGMVAGCYVTEGKIVRAGKLRIYRDDVMIVEGSVRQLKRFKDDVKEVSGGFECGVSIEGFDGIKIGDVIECYITEEIPA